MVLAIASSTASSQPQFLRVLDAGSSDIAEFLIETSDNGYVVLAESDMNEPNGDMLVVKCNALGRVVWATLDEGDSWDFPLCVVETVDGGLLVGGRTWSFGAGDTDIFLVKLDGSGNLQWAKTLGGSKDDYIEDLFRTSDGKFAIAATTENFGATNYDILVCRLDDQAFQQWWVIISTGGTESEQGTALIQTDDLGFAVLGRVTPPPYSDQDVMLCRLNPSASLE